MKKIYVASSWRNEYQQLVVERLRMSDFIVYDFKNPIDEGAVFHWKDIHPMWKNWGPHDMRKVLEHPLALAGFKSDFKHLKECDALVLLRPCGASAHLEAGYVIGQGKPVFICYVGVDGDPELMYKMATEVLPLVPIEKLVQRLNEVLV